MVSLKQRGRSSSSGEVSVACSQGSSEESGGARPCNVTCNLTAFNRKQTSTTKGKSTLKNKSENKTQLLQ